MNNMLFLQPKETLKVMVELLKHPVFMMFAVSNFFTSLGYPIPYTFIPVSPFLKAYLYILTIRYH
jgi:hypothetical protein